MPPSFYSERIYGKRYNFDKMGQVKIEGWDIIKCCSAVNKKALRGVRAIGSNPESPWAVTHAISFKVIRAKIFEGGLKPEERHE
jgi:hypothetical protein